jgi:hypothetical protein
MAHPLSRLLDATFVQQVLGLFPIPAFLCDHRHPYIGAGNGFIQHEPALILGKKRPRRMATPRVGGRFRLHQLDLRLYMARRNTALFAGKEPPVEQR